ncbi:MAG: hypothetical protein RLZZ420_2570 [Bacteroidota bacterium]|jgi:hypothetical protein
MSNEKTFAIYCKTYSRDFLRVKRLLASIDQFNQDKIPVYVSTPAHEKDLFDRIVEVNHSAIWIADENIIYANSRVPKGIHEGKSGYLVQAMVRPEFWRLGLAKNYLCIDSDSQFIKNFYLSDFLDFDGNPFTVIHQNKELLMMAANRGKSKVIQDFHGECARIKSVFNRAGPDYSYMPSPFIWSSEVWKSLDDQYLKPQGKTIWDVVTRDLVEYLWYGEALLAYQAIPIKPIEPLFRVYHYDWQYYVLQRQGENLNKVKDNYLGVIYQSNWESEMDYGSSDKGLLSRSLKSIKRFGRYLQSFL